MRHRLLRVSANLPRMAPHLVVAIAALELYGRVNRSVPKEPALAHEHAEALVGLEQRLGILIEPRLQYLALHHGRPPLLSPLLDDTAVRAASKLIYAGGQVPWVASLLLWVLLFRPRLFTRLCILAIAATFIGILIAAWYPVAPPRFVLVGQPYGMQDVTMMTASAQELRELGGYDPYAAMPSIHMVWALVTGLGLFVAGRRWDQRMLSLLFPTLMVATVVVTANHYVLDCVASFALVSACLATYWCWRRLWRAWRARAGDIRPVVGMQRALRVERRRSPDLRPLDCPILLCAVTGMLLVPAADIWQRLPGALLLLVGALVRPLALLHFRESIPIRSNAQTAEWFSGFLMVAGATTIGAVEIGPRMVGTLCWITAALVPLFAHLRVPTLFAAVASRTVASRGTMRAEVSHRAR